MFRSAPARVAFAAIATLSVFAAIAPGADAANTKKPANKPATTTQAPATIAPAKLVPTLKLGAIPDQDPTKLVTINSAMATYLAARLGVKVEYVPVTDYAAAVNLFRTGDLDLVWFGGLTGTQARLQTPGATILAQRDIDASFHSVLIVNTSVKIPPIDIVTKLSFLKGLRFTYGSNQSTSGFLMPEYFLDQARVNDEKDFDGKVGFSGSHDKTIDLVQAGTFEAGALNEQVWNSRRDKGTVDLTKVQVVFRSPAYNDYHWIAGPKTDERFGAGFAEKEKAALLSIDINDADQAKLLGLYGAKKFIAARADDYTNIEAIGRKLGLIN